MKAISRRDPAISLLELDGRDVRRPTPLKFADGLTFTGLKVLVVKHWPLSTAQFKATVFPCLTELIISGPFDDGNGGSGDSDRFELALPELTKLVLEYPGGMT